jgi:hypothetical protein
MEKSMTFHPEALDQEQLKRLAKNMKKGSGSVLPQQPLTLTQSQELLARALGHANWHAANQPRKEKLPAEVEASNPIPAMARGSDRSWRGIDALFFHERILLGGFLATIHQQDEQAKRLWQVAQYEDTQAQMLQRLQTVGLEGLEAVQAETGRVANGYEDYLTREMAVEKAANLPGITSVGTVLRGALIMARRVRVLPTVYFQWLKEIDPRLWNMLKSGNSIETNERVDPLKKDKARLDLLEDLLCLVEAGIAFPEAVRRVGVAYRQHGLNDLANTLDDWEGQEQLHSDWVGFLTDVLRKYNPRQAIMFDLLARAGSAQNALERVVRQARGELSMAAAQTVVNNHAFLGDGDR